MKRGRFSENPEKMILRPGRFWKKMIILARYRFLKYGASGVMLENLKQANQIITQKIRNLEPRLVKSSWSKKKDKGQLQPRFY